MNLTDSRLAQGGCEKLDLALLSFFEQFRKIYVGDQVQKTSKVRAKSDLSIELQMHIIWDLKELFQYDEFSC